MNLVLLRREDNRVMGYESFKFLDKERSRVLAQGLRIDECLRGQGVGKWFMRRTERMLREKCGKVK